MMNLPSRQVPRPVLYQLSRKNLFTNPYLSFVDISRYLNLDSVSSTELVHTANYGNAFIVVASVTGLAAL